MHIVIEGQDATGKDTQAALLADYLRKKGEKVTHYSESGTGSEDEFIREISRLNYGSQQNIDHRTRVLLYLINRYEQWRRLAEPTLRAGGTVITTRNWFSTLVYEGYGAGVSRPLITKLHKTIMPESYFHPDKIVVLTLDDQTRTERLGTQNRSSEVWKSQPDNFQHRVNQGYLQVAKKWDLPTLSAAGSIEEVQKSLRKLFQI